MGILNAGETKERLMETHTPSEKADNQRGSWANSFLENTGVGGIIASIASISILVSFIYDWGFFFALGVSFSETPTTITDHMQSWLQWLPIVLVVGITLLTYGLIVLRVSRGRPDKRTHSNSRSSAIWQFGQEVLSSIVLVGPIMFVLVWVFWGDIALIALVAGLFFLWWPFMSWIFEHKAAYTHLPNVIRDISIVFPPVVLLAFWMGMASAGSTREEPSMTHRLIMDGSDEITETLETELLRAFEEWLLVRSENNQLSWIRLDDVKRIESLTQRSHFKGLACEVLDRWCLPAPSVN